MKPNIALLPPLLTALALAACAGGTGRSEPQDSEETVLEVDNQASLDMTIYVLRSSGERRRMGLAVAHTVSHFTIPAVLIFGATPLRFLADPVGASRTPVTNEIVVTPGDTVVLRIPPGLPD